MCTAWVDFPMAHDIRRLVPNGSDNGNYFDLPTMNPNYHGKSYRYSYGISAARPTNLANALCKVPNLLWSCLLLLKLL